MGNILSENDKAAIEDLLRRMQYAWAVGNGKLYGDCFAVDAHYVEATGSRVIGKEIIAERHQKIFDTFFKSTTIEGTRDVEYQVIDEQVVLVHSAGNVYFPGESGKELEPNGLVSMCVAKQEGKWQIKSFQNTPTGKLRKLKFFLRFFKSRFYLFRKRGEAKNR